MEGEELNLILERLNEPDNHIRKNAINMLIDMVKSSHSGSLDTLRFQFLNDKRSEILGRLENLSDFEKRQIFDVLSAISVMGEEEKILEYRMQGNVIKLSEWGHLYVKKLVKCVLDSKYGKNAIPLSQTKEVSLLCVDFLFKNNSEVDAIDFLLELGNINLVLEYVDSHNFRRIFQYLEEMAVFYNLEDVIIRICMKMEEHSRAVIRLISKERKREAVEYTESIADPIHKRQCMYILARCGMSTDISYYSHFKEDFKAAAKILELEDPKKIKGFFKGCKIDRETKQIPQTSLTPVSLCNALVHYGFGRDLIFFNSTEDSPFSEYKSILENDIPDLISILGSVGLIKAWDPENVLGTLQEFIFEGNTFRRTGSLLALALASARVPDDLTFLNLMTNNLQVEGVSHILATLLSIQIMYSGTWCKEVKEVVTPLVFSDIEEVSLFAIFTLGSVFSGSADDELSSLFMQAYVEKMAQGDSQFFKMLLLGLACLYYRRREVNPGIEDLDLNFSRHGAVLVRGFQFAGTGDPEVIEEILSDCFTGETDALLESIGLLSISVVGVGDEVATQMVTRLINSSLLLESPHLKSVLPLCFSILYASQPNQQVVSVLEKSIGSGDSSVVIPSLYGMGIVGAGSINGRIQKYLDKQYAYQYKDTKAAFVLKISQGLLNLGKGMVSLSPLVYDKSVILSKSLIGLVGTSMLLLDPLTSPILTDHPYLFYLAMQACSSKTVVTEDSKGIPVRVGQPVNTVGLVGDPRRITSIQSHTMPIILGTNERAEIDEGSYSPYIEDVVIIRD